MSKSSFPSDPRTTFLITSYFSLVEATSVLARLLHGRKLTLGAYRRTLSSLNDDFSDVLTVQEVGNDVLFQAVEVAAQTGLRAPDALQLAAALTVRGLVQEAQLVFVCADHRLCESAVNYHLHEFAVARDQDQGWRERPARDESRRQCIASSARSLLEAATWPASAIKSVDRKTTSIWRRSSTKRVANEAIARGRPARFRAGADRASRVVIWLVRNRSPGFRSPKRASITGVPGSVR